MSKPDTPAASRAATDAELPEVPCTWQKPGESDDAWIDRITGAAQPASPAPLTADVREVLETCRRWHNGNTWREHPEAEKAAAWEKLRDDIDAALASPQVAPEGCPHCDDTGDVHSIDGEWRGRCTCPQGKGKPWDTLTALEKAPKLIEELEAESERITRYSNSPSDGLLQSAADALRELAAEVAAPVQVAPQTQKKSLAVQLDEVIEDAQQAAFEDWLEGARPSGDADQVQREWEFSGEREDFEDELREAIARLAPKVAPQDDARDAAPTRALINLEGLADRLLAPREIVRDADGYLIHPEVPACDENVRTDVFLSAFGLDTAFVGMEDDCDDEDLIERVLVDAESCLAWTPTPPEGAVWVLLEIYPTEDGPYAMFARTAVPKGTPRRRDVSTPAAKPTEEQA